MKAVCAWTYDSGRLLNFCFSSSAMMMDWNVSRECVKVCRRDVIQEGYRNKSRSGKGVVNGRGGFNDLPLRAIQGKAGQRSKEARAADWSKRHHHAGKQGSRPLPGAGGTQECRRRGKLVVVQRQVRQRRSRRQDAQSEDDEQSTNINTLALKH